MLKSAMIACCLIVGTATLSHAANATEGPQSIVSPAPAKQQAYPKIVLYSVSWCSHCKEAKEYFTHNNIPFVNHDVELEEEAMDTLTNKYKSRGVPVIVLGNDEKVLKGFNKDAFEKAVEEMRKKK